MVHLGLKPPDGTGHCMLTTSVQSAPVLNFHQKATFRRFLLASWKQQVLVYKACDRREKI